MQVSQANRPVLIKLTSFVAKIEASHDILSAKIESLRCFSVGVASVVGVG